MRLFRVLLPALVVAGLATPAWAAQPPSGPPPAGWQLTGSQLIWRSPAPVPVGDAVIEFWDGDRPLGRPKLSPDHRTFTLDQPRITDPGKLSVRAGGERVDVKEPLRPMASPPAPAPAPLPASAVDPGTPGPFQTVKGEYTLDPITVPSYPAPLEMQAVVVAPKNAYGKRPLALFLHGRHYTCYFPSNPDDGLLEWPCPQDTKPVPSYRGYLQAQQLLASQGYVTVSISANSVNAQDQDVPDLGAQARSTLVRQHLARWADWAGAGRGSAPDVVRASPVADLSNVLLYGHSRGGEGVNRAAMDSINPPPGDTLATRWNIRGTVLVGPTIFGHNPAPDVPSVTILPGCDGDVSDLQGQMYLDATRGVSRGAALHSALYTIGANHNFFNTEWTPGQSEAPSFDDAARFESDAVCATGTATRLTAAQQQTVGATYTAAAARLFVAGDDRVLPLVDGSGARAPSADPARVLSHALGGARTPFVVPDDKTTASGSGRVCEQVTLDAATACIDPADRLRRPPSFTPFWRLRQESGRFAVQLSAGQPAVIKPGQPVSLLGSRDLALRLVVPPNSQGNRFDVAITDKWGRRANLGSVTLNGLPATDQLVGRWAQEVRVPLHGVDLRNVNSLELTGSGSAWLVDAYGWNFGTPDPRPVALPRIDLGNLTVKEGDSGTQTYQIPATITGSGPATLRLSVSDDRNPPAYTTKVVTLQPGQHTIEVPISVTGNTRWSRDSRREVLMKAVQGSVIGSALGGLTVLNDDPEPVVTVTPIADQVTEGGQLKWRLTASAPADDRLYRVGVALAPASGPELSSTDVDPAWFQSVTFGEDPKPSRPLSTTRVSMYTPIDPGQLTAEVAVPTVADQETEPAEHIRLAWLSPTGNEPESSGTVTDP